MPMGTGMRWNRTPASLPTITTVFWYLDALLLGDAAQALARPGVASGIADYPKLTRTAPLSRFEIKAGWEIPAVLEQALNSDLPGELKALVTSNVYDTGTGQFLLIPQGSRLVGVYDSRIGYGQDGAHVIWDRIIFSRRFVARPGRHDRAGCAGVLWIP
jgi:hypothetical protein